MKKLTTLFAVLVFAGAALAAINPGIEVLGIEVLNGVQMVETHSTDAPTGSQVVAVMDQGAGPMVVGSGPVCPTTGLCTVAFPFEHPNNRVELRDANGTLLCSGVTVADEFE